MNRDKLLPLLRDQVVTRLRWMPAAHTVVYDVSEALFMILPRMGTAILPNNSALKKNDE
jgi:hypothetical protein